MKSDKKMKNIIIVLAILAVLAITVCIVLLAIKGADKKETGSADYAGLPTPKVAEIPTEEDWSLVLVNRYNTLDPDYMPELTEIAPDTDIYADTRVAAAYNEMDEAARNDGITLPLASGYVSKEDQKTAYEAEVKTYTDQGMDEEAAQTKAAFTVSPPGRAEENYGLSVGFAHENGIDGFIASLVYEWLRAHAAEYGFIERYTAEKEDVTQMKARPWHWRYVGREAAEEMLEKGLALEEYAESRTAPDTAETQPAGTEEQTAADPALEGLLRLDTVDEDSICGFLNGFVEGGYAISDADYVWRDYDCTAPDAQENAIRHLFYQSFGFGSSFPQCFYADGSGEDLREKYVTHVDLSDPALLGFTTEYPYSFYRIDGAFADEVLQKTMNVAPDHDYVYTQVMDYPYTGSTHRVIFYSDGYYYVWLPEAGDYWENRSAVSDVQKLEDGRISLRFRYSLGGDYDGSGYVESKFGYYTAVLGQKEVAGRKMWSVYSVKKD